MNPEGNAAAGATPVPPPPPGSRAGRPAGLGQSGCGALGGACASRRGRPHPTPAGGAALAGRMRQFQLTCLSALSCSLHSARARPGPDQPLGSRPHAQGLSAPRLSRQSLLITAPSPACRSGTSYTTSGASEGEVAGVANRKSKPGRSRNRTPGPRSRDEIRLLPDGRGIGP